MHKYLGEITSQFCVKLLSSFFLVAYLIPAHAEDLTTRTVDTNPETRSQPGFGERIQKFRQCLQQENLSDEQIGKDACQAERDLLEATPPQEMRAEIDTNRRFRQAQSVTEQAKMEQYLSRLEEKVQNQPVQEREKRAQDRQLRRMYACLDKQSSNLSVQDLKAASNRIMEGCIEKVAINEDSANRLREHITKVEASLRSR